MSSSNVAVRAAEQAWEAAKRDQRDYMNQVVRGEVANKQEAQTELENHNKRVEQAQQLYMQLASRDDPPRYDSALTSAPGGPHPLPVCGYDPPKAPARPVQTTIRSTASAAGPMPGDFRRTSQGDYVPAALPTGGAGGGGPSRAAIAQGVGPMQRAVVEQPTKDTVLGVQGNIQNPQSAAAAVEWMTWYTVFAWVSCLCCCWPIGLVSVIYSCKMQQSVTNNNAESAKRNAKWTLVWGIVSVVVGFIVIIAASAA